MRIIVVLVKTNDSVNGVVAQGGARRRGMGMCPVSKILMPILGGNKGLAKARAIENQVFLISSGYDYPTSILDPEGELLAITRGQGTVATATIDLGRRYEDKWLGDMRERFMK